MLLRSMFIVHAAWNTATMYISSDATRFKDFRGNRSLLIRLEKKFGKKPKKKYIYWLVLCFPDFLDAFYFLAKKTALKKKSELVLVTLHGMHAKIGKTQQQQHTYKL